MQIVTLDFETYFDDEYTLKKLSTEAYIRDSRFEALGLGVRFVNGELRYFPDPDEFLHHMREEPSKFAVLCHHAHFDGLILSHHYGVKPHAWLDTLSMARLLLGNHLSVSLDSLARHFGLSAKSVPYDLFRGRHWADLSLAAQREVANGCLHDVALTWDIFNKLAPSFPVEEYPVVDETIRMFTEPRLEADIDLLGKVWSEENERRRAGLADLGVSDSDLQSSDKFADLLRAAGVEPATKAGKNGPIYAFAKTDEFMKQLLEHDDERVALLAAARLGIKSTIDQTRAERLGWMSRRGSTMPVYLSYAAAHTTRWGGGDKVNWQNFRRVDKKSGKAYIRQAIKAPAEHVIIKADKSQVECRFLNMVAGQWDVIERFAKKEDPYVGIASKFYGRPITRSDEAERGVGKQLELSCGYGAGASTIVRTAARGTYGPPVKLTESEGLLARDLYRDTHPAVVQLWKQAGRIIAGLAGTTSPIRWGVLTVHSNAIILPNGCPLHYPELEYHRDVETGDEFWRYRTRHGWAKLYGGKLVENVIQALSRVDMSQTILRLRARGYRVSLMEHDALAIVARNDSQLDKHVEVVKAEMSRSPTWLPGIPLDCEVTVGERYG